MIHDDLSSVSLEQLQRADNWQAKYRLITDWGRLIALKPTLRQAEYAIKGCETSAWMTHEYVAGEHRFFFDSDSRVIKGLAALLLSLIDQQSHETLMALPLTMVLHQAGLEKHMTPSRNNGFRAMALRAWELAGIEIELQWC